MHSTNIIMECEKKKKKKRKKILARSNVFWLIWQMVKKHESSDTPRFNFIIVW